MLRWIARWLAPAAAPALPRGAPRPPGHGRDGDELRLQHLRAGQRRHAFRAEGHGRARQAEPTSKGVASNPMVLFLAINTSAITLHAAHRHRRPYAPLPAPPIPSAIWIPTLIATDLLHRRRDRPHGLPAGREEARPRFRHLADALEGEPAETTDPATYPRLPDDRGGTGCTIEAQPLETCAKAAGRALRGGGRAGRLRAGDFARLAQELLAPPDVPGHGRSPGSRSWLLTAADRARCSSSVSWPAACRVYESAVAGAREGLEVAVRIVPYLVAILVAVGIFRASGALDVLIQASSIRVTSSPGDPGRGPTHGDPATRFRARVPSV